jgi:hypothetical protein
VPFGAFASVMDAVKQAGITNISIVTQPLEAKASAASRPALSCPAPPWRRTCIQRPVSVSNGDFGSRFGWYVEIIKRKVSQNWNRYEVDPHTPKGAMAQIYFRVNRQGAPLSNFKINTAERQPHARSIMPLATAAC